VRVRRVPVPQIQGAGEALVRVSLAAICGSDLHVYAGREEGLQHGTTMGHEFVGHVVQVPLPSQRSAWPPRGAAAIFPGAQPVQPALWRCADRKHVPRELLWVPAGRDADSVLTAA
jgi:NADPH:quinone reductase-like Zn-dependent oxidoreductase